MIDDKHDTVDILKYLQQVAVLVQGNWVVQSELVYPKDKTSAHNGINSELMCRARDYIVCKTKALFRVVFFFCD